MAVTGDPLPCPIDPRAILALDSSSARVSAAFGERVAEQPAERDQAACLVRLAAQVSEGGRPVAVAATVGPGSFTGIRAALALAQGLAMGFGVPAVAVSTAEALAAEVGEGRVLVAIDSRRGHAFLAGFIVRAGIPEEILPPVVWRQGERLPGGDWGIIVGDAAALLDPRAVPSWPRAQAVGAVAAARLSGRILPRPFAALYVDPPAVRAPPGMGVAC